MDAFWAAPPVTRTLAAAVFVESVLAAVNLLNPYWLIYNTRFIFKATPEIWRLISSFLLTFKLGIIMDPFWIWQNGTPLERNSTRFNSASFFIYIVFIGVALIILAGHFIGSSLLLGPLSLAITYTFAQENRGQRITFFIIEMDVKWLPYARVLLTFIMNGSEAAMTDATGIVAAHLYDFLTVYWPSYGGGTNLVRTPQLINRWFYGDGPRVETKGHGTSFQARPPGSQNPTHVSSSSAWNSRGPGRRLGGD